MIETNIQNNALVIRVATEELDMYNSPELREVITKQLQTKHNAVVLDLQMVKYMDSSAIGLLFYLRKLIKNHGGNMILVHLSEQVYKVLLAMRALSFFTHYANTAEALSAVENAAA